MQDLENVWVARCFDVAKNQQIFVVELYNYLEQVTYLLLLIVK